MSNKSFAKHKVLSPEEIEKIAERNSKSLGFKKGNFLDLMIRGAIGDITKSTEIILREKQRINKAKKSIKNILIVLKSGKSKEVKKIEKKFYNDILQYNISETYSKFKN